FLAGVVAGAVGLAVGFFIFVKRVQDNLRRFRQERRSVTLPAARLSDEAIAPCGWSVQRLDGSTVYLDAVAGRTLFLNIWSTMCPPCVMELASIERLHALLSPEGIAFMCVATDPDIERLRAWVSEHRVTVPVFALGEQE